MDVSVIVPIYNSERHLRRCLRSLSIQKDVAAEFICIDDGSDDNSMKICNDFKDRDDRFIIIRNKHEGVSAARNTGLDIAKGRYICFLDSDDRYVRGALKKLFDMAEKSGCDSIKFNARVVHGKKWMRDSFRSHDETIEGFIPNDIFRYKDCRPFIWAHFIRSDILTDVRFDTSLEIGEDQEYVIRYMIGCRKVRFVSNRFYVHYNLMDSSFNKEADDSEWMSRMHIKIVRTVMSYVSLRTPEFIDWADSMLSTYNCDDISTQKEVDSIMQMLQCNQS
jgi:glycosyltransferase involved in cell wall biosynthesis